MDTDGANDLVGPTPDKATRLRWRQRVGRLLVSPRTAVNCSIGPDKPITAEGRAGLECN